MSFAHWMQGYVEWWLLKRSGYLEQLAAAYFKETQLSPRKVQLVEQKSADGLMVCWYFKEGTKHEND